MRRGFGIGAAILTVIVLVVVGAIAYNIGWSEGVGTHLPAGATNVPPGYYYGPGMWHAGFGIFGFLWFLLILFGIFWLFRLAFWGFGARRFMGGGYGPRGWGHHGYGSFEERAQEWHRRQHGEQPPAGTPPPPPDTRSV